MIERRIDGNFNTEADGTGRFSAEFLRELIDYHTRKLVPKYRLYENLYKGKHKILNKKVRDENKPNNKIVNDFYGQIIDNTVGYFLGNPIIINYNEPTAAKSSVEPNDVGVDLSDIGDNAIQDCLDNILIANDFNDTIIEWGKEGMIKGLSHLLVYQNEQSETKIMRVSPEDMIIVYKNSSTKEVQYAIRLYDIDTEDTKKTTHYAEVYSASKMELFKSVDSVDGSIDKGRQFAGYEFVEESPIIYGRVPVTTFYNNEERMSDLEKVKTLIDDYDKVLSEVSDEHTAFRNAYLMLKNMIVGTEGKKQLKDEGIIEVMENGDVKFITKQVQTEAIENHLNRLEANIYKFSQVPNLSDENFAGNLSGVAIRFKLFGLETKCIIKERKMEKALRELVRILSFPITVNTGKILDIVNVKIEFTRNIPNNITEIVDAVTKLNGTVDKETLLALLPFVDNPKDVLERLEEDTQRDKQQNDIYSQQNINADAQNLFPNLNELDNTNPFING